VTWPPRSSAWCRAVAAVPGTDLARAGWHEFDGEVTLAGMLAFLPRHQADHAAQLELLAQPPSCQPGPGEGNLG
jgi:hypothetical protein